MTTVNGERWGTAAEIAADLSGGNRVTPGMVRKWAARDGLRSAKDGRTVYYPFGQAARIETAKRLSRRGRRRKLDSALVGA